MYWMFYSRLNYYVIFNNSYTYRRKQTSKNVVKESNEITEGRSVDRVLLPTAQHCVVSTKKKISKL